MKTLTIIFFLAFPMSYFQADPFKEKRQQLVWLSIEKRGVKNKAVLHAMRTVPRHLFVPGKNSSSAYEDRPQPIGYGQTISQPYIVAYMTEALDPKPHYKVLEIGTGSGYQAAILSGLVREVYTIEIIPELGNTAAARLKKLGYKNVAVKIQDGYFGWAEHGPYDGIIVTAASEYVPPALLSQLKDSGKIIIPIGSPFMNQMLMLVQKNGKKVTTKSLMPVVFVPFTRKKT